MPIFEYHCSNCGYAFELLEKINNKEPHVCPQCQGDARRTISPSHFHLKGKGWYVTDYKDKQCVSDKGKHDACACCPHQNSKKQSKTNQSET